MARKQSTRTPKDPEATKSSTRKSANGNAKGYARRKSGKPCGKEGFKEGQDQDRTGSAYSNDPAWYASDPSLARDSAAIPFSWATGTTSSLGAIDSNIITALDTTAENQLKYFTAPGICTLYLNPSLGEMSSPSSPVNIAATAMYSYIRHANSGHANYDSNDLMLYILAMGDILSYINFLIRAYGTASLYSTRNRYMPDAILRAQKIDPNNMRNNLAQFRYGLNLMLNKVSSLAIPANMSYFKRKAFLYSGLYSEGTSAKDQLYMYAPFGFFQFSHAAADNAGCLSYVSYMDRTHSASSSGYTVTQLLSKLNQMIDALILDEDINIMSGDILKAYGENGILKFGRVDADFTIPLTFDVRVLEQMKNATVLPESLTVQKDMAVAIQQDATKAYLESNMSRFVFTSSDSIKSKVESFVQSQNRILTTTTADTSPELVLESTRLMIGVNWDADPLVSGNYDATLFSGTEVPVWATITSFDPTTALVDSDYIITGFDGCDQVSTSGTGASSTLYSVLTVLTQLAAFKFAPAITWVEGESGTGGKLQLIGAHRYFGFDNYAVLTNEDLRRMHEACLLNMTRVPAIGSIYNG